MEETQAPKKRGRQGSLQKPKEAIGLEILCTSQTMEEAREKVFMENMDETGGVTINNPVCGGSVYIKSLNLFPKTNMRCTCGKPGHYAVKYTFK